MRWVPVGHAGATTPLVFAPAAPQTSRGAPGSPPPATRPAAPFCRERGQPTFEAAPTGQREIEGGYQSRIARCAVAPWRGQCVARGPGLVSAPGAARNGTRCGRCAVLPPSHPMGGTNSQPPGQRVRRPPFPCAALQFLRPRLHHDRAPDSKYTPYNRQHLTASPLCSDVGKARAKRGLKCRPATWLTPFLRRVPGVQPRRRLPGLRDPPPHRGGWRTGGLAGPPAGRLVG